MLDSGCRAESLRHGTVDLQGCTAAALVAEQQSGFTTGGGTWSKRWRIKTGTCPPDRDDYVMMEHAPNQALQGMSAGHPGPVRPQGGLDPLTDPSAGAGAGGVTDCIATRALPASGLAGAGERGTHHWVEDRRGRDSSHRLPAIDSRGQTPASTCQGYREGAPSVTD